MDRRQFLSSAALSTSLAAATANAETPARKASREPGRRPRKIYFNDARHHYLYAFEPPMTREDAHRPVDELASTAIDTFIYGVETGGFSITSAAAMTVGPALILRRQMQTTRR